MLILDRVLAPGDSTVTLTLRYAERCKSRLRVELDDGTEAGLFLPRGTVLHAQERVQGASGPVVEVRAASEELYEVRAAHDAADPHFDLLRATYHLGNRHVPVQLAPGCLRLERDTVLREMLLRLGLCVSEIVAPFEPEAGAYGGGHRHDHDDTGAMLGETLSREAHAAGAPDFSSLSFQPLGR
ncbi:MAG: urease accessory protein UreE [Panacagrimonas sp.]